MTEPVTKLPVKNEQKATERASAFSGGGRLSVCGEM